MDERLTAAQAASQIVGLINSRPATPWPHEIEAIVARVGPAPASLSLPAHVVAYRERAQAYYRHSVNVLGPLPDNTPDDHPEWDRNAALCDELDAATAPILQGSATTWGDIVGLASIVAHEEGYDLDALEDRPTDVDALANPGDVARKALALAVLRLQARAIPQLVPADPELVRLISEWRRQRDIVDGTVNDTDGHGLSFEEWKPYEAIIGRASSAASDLAQQIWERAKAETWSGGPVNPLTLAVLAEIAFHYENGATRALESDGDGCFDEKSSAELMVGVLAFARSAGVGSDLLPMEGRFLPPALLQIKDGE